MINASEFEYLSYQAAVFTPDLQLNVNRVLAALVDKYSDRFNGDPIVLPPFPPNAPKEIPRVILKNANESQKLQVALSRLDIFWTRIYLENPILNIGEFIEESQSVISFYKDITRARFGRLAFVVNRIRITDNPGKELVNHFCKSEWLDEDAKVLNRPDNFEIHAFKKYQVPGKNVEMPMLPLVNSWIRHKTATIKATKTEQINAVLVEQDLNTLQEQIEVNDLDPIKLHYFTVVSDEMDEILSRYYPEVS